MRYIIKRFLMSVIALAAITTLTFFLMHLVPGGPFLGDKKLPPNIMHNMEAKYGLNRSLIGQFFTYINNLLHGDLGMSIKQQGRSINDIIGESFPVSAKLGLVALSFALIVGTLLGILSSLKNGKAADRTVMVLVTLGMSIPSFVIATVSMIIFGVMLSLLPTYGLDDVPSYILPAFALGCFPLSFITRLVRSSMLDIMGQDYIKTARAKGLKESSVIIRHALKNAMQPVMTYMGTLLAAVLTGSFVIEKVFTIPGLGKYFVESINNRDYPLIMGTTVFYAAFMIATYFVVDALYVLIDPRIKLK